MYEVFVAARFEAAHRLVGDFGSATRTHGHTYRMEAIVRGEYLRDDETLCDSCARPSKDSPPPCTIGIWLRCRTSRA